MFFDMSHLRGLVAAGVNPSPFEHIHIGTITTYQALRGHRGAMIIFQRGENGMDKKEKRINYDFEAKIKEAVCPSHQGEPHNPQLLL